MSSEWNKTKLGDVCEVVRGGSPRPIIDYITDDPDGVNWLKIGDVKETDKYFDHAAEKIKRTGIPKTREVISGDLILSNSMSFGRAFITRIDGYIHDGWLRLRPDQKALDKEYLYYFLTSALAQNQLKAVATGSVVNNLKSDTVKAVNIDLPPLVTQRRIAQFLSMFDEKIVINNEINKNLSDQALAIFQSWFIEYTPFGGIIPPKWASTVLGNVCLCELGGTPSRSKPEYWNGDIPWINSGEVNKFRITKPSEMITELGLNKSATKLLPAKTTVIAITGATLGQVSLLEIASCANQSVVGVVPNNHLPYEYIYPFIVTNIQELVSHQTGGAQQHINKQNVESLPITVPDSAILNAYVDLVSGLYAAIANNCFENDRLADLRDALLPKLMSGEIDVSDLSV